MWDCSLWLFVTKIQHAICHCNIEPTYFQKAVARTIIAIAPKNPTNEMGMATVVITIALFVVESPPVVGVCFDGVPMLEPCVGLLGMLVCAVVH